MFDAAAVAELEQAAGRTGERAAGLGRLTTLGCGGAAAFLIDADSSSHLAALLAVTARRGIPTSIIGLGSNLLVADSGWDGLAIRLSGALKLCKAIGGGRLECGGGASLPRAASTAAEAGMSGLEPLAGIPGTVGGAVAMNAGAWGTSIGDLIAEAEICLPGECRIIAATDLEFSYRDCRLPAGAVISRAILSMRPGEPDEIFAGMEGYRRRRRETQPVGERTCGSVFRNPEDGMSAGELLDRAGCKGLRRGGASVSLAHANFIVNNGGASAADVIGLMDECRARVHEKFGITLEPEVRMLGETGLKPL